MWCLKSYWIGEEAKYLESIIATATARKGLPEKLKQPDFPVVGHNARG